MLPCCEKGRHWSSGRFEERNPEAHLNDHKRALRQRKRQTNTRHASIASLCKIKGSTGERVESMCGARAVDNDSDDKGKPCYNAATAA